jgi:small GTP-binding protein
LVISDKSQRKRIIFIGRKNVGKSALINSFFGQDVFNVDEESRTKTEILEKVMDLPPYGHVILVDTFGIDFTREPAQNKLQKTIEEISSADFVVVVLDAREKLSTDEKNIFNHVKKLTIPFVAAVNKIEYGINSELINGLRALNIIHFEISCKENVGIDALKSRITRLLPMEQV